MKMTVAKLKELKKQKDIYWNKFKNANDKLKKICTHPHSAIRTKVGYETDTLGNNGTNYYIDICTLCEAHIDSYGGVYGGYEGRAKYKEME